MKIEWFIANETAAGSPDGTESVFFSFFDSLLLIWTTFVVGEPFCYLETPF